MARRRAGGELSRAHRLLIGLHPRAFRDDFGEAVVEMLRLRGLEARRSGRWSYSRFWWRELLGLAASAARERLRRSASTGASPTASIAGATPSWSRPSHSTNWLDTAEAVMREVRHAMRRLVRAPSFTLPASLTLALAFGLNAAIFTLVLRVVLAPLPYPDSDRLVALEHNAAAFWGEFGIDGSSLGLTTGLYAHYMERSQVFESMALHLTFEGTVSDDGEAERVMVTRATPSLIDVLEAEPRLGRWFTEEEGEAGGARAVVLSHGLWQRRYGGDASVIGRSVLVDGEGSEIVGVMPAGFHYPDDRTELWLSLPFGPPMVRAGGFNFQGVARLRDGVPVEAARAELDRLIPQYTDRFPGNPVAVAIVDDARLRSSLVSLKDSIVGPTAERLWILLGAVGIALLVGCANVANLFLVRLESRLRDVAVRQALGAGRRTVTSYFLSESTLLALAGAILGLALAAGSVHLLAVVGPRDLPRLHEVRIDALVIAFTFGLASLAALGFGSIPPLRRMPGPATTLYESGRSNTSSARRMRVRHLLMGGQVALALVLLVAAGLMGRSFQQLLRARLRWCSAWSASTA